MLPVSTAQYYDVRNWTSYSLCSQNRMCSHHAGQTTGLGSLLTAAEIALALFYKTSPLLAGFCQLS